VDTQYVIEQADLESMLGDDGALLLPAQWRTTRSGRPMPDVAAALARSRREH
jgi:hypothetical protein